MPDMKPDRATVAAYVAFILISGTVPVAIRLGSLELPSLWAAGLRFLLGSAILAVIAHLRHARMPRGVQLLGPLVFAVTFFGGFIPLFYFGLSQAPAAVASFAGAFEPLATILLAGAIGLELVTPRAILGALL